MVKKLILLFVLAFFYNNSFATMFVPMPLDKQVEEATSGAEVQLSSTRVFKNASGTIMTEYLFDVLESYNLASDDLVDQKLELTMPGGVFDGVTSMIDGAPQFNVGEKTFVLLKKVESRNYLSNFTLGKYKIKDYEGKPFYVSEVFPMDPHIGRISKEKMIDLMKLKWKTSFDDPSDTVKDRTLFSRDVPIVSIIKKLNDRSPAQEAAEVGIPFFFWAALAFVVIFFAFIFFKLEQSGHKNKSI